MGLATQRKKSTDKCNGDYMHLTVWQIRINMAEIFKSLIFLLSRSFLFNLCVFNQWIKVEFIHFLDYKLRYAHLKLIDRKSYCTFPIIKS